MKKNVTLFGIAVLLTAIVFSFAACKHDSDDTEPVTLPAGAPATMDFGFIRDSGEAKPLSEYLNGVYQVKITDGRLTHELSTPRTECLDDLPIEGVTATPPDAQQYTFYSFCDATGDYILYMKGPGTGEYDVTYLVYVDKDVTINGTHSETEDGYTDTDTYNVTLKQGWNYMSRTRSDSGTTTVRTYTASTTKPAGATWTVSLSL